MLFIQLTRTIALHIRSPQCQVVSEQLHNQGGVFVAFFAQCVQLSDGVIECGFRKSTGTVGRVQDFVIEHLRREQIEEL